MKYTVKFLLTALLCCILCANLRAQVGINTDNSTPDSSAILDIKSISQGTLLPRMTTAQRDAINNPATGLVVYDITTQTFWYYSNRQWNEIKNGSTLISATDLVGVLPAPDFECFSTVGTLPIGDLPYHVAVSGNYAYVLDERSDELRVVDVSNPGGPQRKGSLSIGTFPTGLEVRGNYAYIIDRDRDDLSVIDISNPDMPELKNTVALGQTPQAMALANDYIYVIDFANRDLTIIDIADPLNAAVTGSTPSLGGGATSFLSRSGQLRLCSR
ncbi:MAG: hypothetical protein AAGF89_01440 [Bacteroidota bacterium]